MDLDKEFFMAKAIAEANKALEIREVPIGAIIECNGKIIGKGYNLRNSLKNSLAHAELMAIDQACKFIGDWRLSDCRMFVTIEPCPMCAGAIVNARIPILIFGAKNPKAGCCGSVLDITNEPGFNHRVTVISGVLEEECKELMSGFFRELRS